MNPKYLGVYYHGESMITSKRHLRLILRSMQKLSVQSAVPLGTDGITEHFKLPLRLFADDCIIMNTHEDATQLQHDLDEWALRWQLHNLIYYYAL